MVRISVCWIAFVHFAAASQRRRLLRRCLHSWRAAEREYPRHGHADGEGRVHLVAAQVESEIKMTWKLAFNVDFIGSTCTALPCRGYAWGCRTFVAVPQVRIRRETRPVW